MIKNSLHEARDLLKSLIDKLKEQNADFNESQTRFHIIDVVVKQCLNWEGQIEVEQHESENGFTDYELGLPRKVVIEAKRESIGFEIPVGRNLRYTLPIKTLIQSNTPLKSAMQQAQNYCSNRGVPIAIVTNGHQYVAFIATRVDGVNIFEGQALVFTSLQDIYDNFVPFWNCLSSEGIEDNRLMRQLTVGDVRLPNKLSNQLIDYPKIRYASDIQVTLRQLSELFIQDTIDDPELEKTFFQQCYCESGVLNQYALLSKSILEARYASIFSASEEQPLVQAVKTKRDRNFDPSVLSEAMSRRPIVLIGDVGVGKTSFIKNLIHNSAIDEFKNAIYIYIDLGSSATLDTDLNMLVLDQIQQQLYDKYDVDISQRGFIQRVYNDEIKRFENGLWGEYKDINPEKYQEKLLEELFLLKSNIRNHTQRSVAHISKERRKQVIICIDNADQRDFDVQQEAFLISQELAKEWKATVFLSVRPQTFYKSKRVGALNAYPHKIFTILPPRVDDVVSKRLRFAAKMARGEKSKVDMGVVTSENLAIFLDVLIRSLNSSKDINEFLTNITGGNIRTVIEFVTGFIGSPNIEAQKIIDIEESQGGYQIPLHEFAKQALLGDYSHYSPETSSSMNVLDISSPDPKEHFLVPLLISYLESKGEHIDKDGFCRTETVITECQNHGFTQKQIEYALRRATNRKLIETSLRVTFEEDEGNVLIGDLPDSFRVTTIGAYHIKKWLGDFAYLDAMLFDTPVLDPSVRELISKKVSSLDIATRYERTKHFKRYLIDNWKQFVSAPSYFDFEDICIECSDSFTKVEKHLARTNKK
ncbi:hypothetical protein FB443_11052 [Vibrio crassostreae]|uniref:hypothetical protein n=1 Tax=Vibrio crassostreae TaxID=246167 RepID=UPI00114DCDE2|nr:hypothetical protein [Vibrio crassostreae]TQL30715.1 hypothetical protein FB443_11052 [Vibrio crassostreae]